MSEKQNRLITDFSDAEYAHAYMGSHTITKIAAQNNHPPAKPGDYLLDLYGVADGARTHDNRNHNPGHKPIGMGVLVEFVEIKHVFCMAFSLASHRLISTGLAPDYP